MALTKAQIAKAARLYGLAMAAHADLAGRRPMAKRGSCDGTKYLLRGRLRKHIRPESS
jgi:hypothetical protein